VATLWVLDIRQQVSLHDAVDFPESLSVVITLSTYVRSFRRRLTERSGVCSNNRLRSRLPVKDDSGAAVNWLLFWDDRRERDPHAVRGHQRPVG